MRLSEALRIVQQAPRAAEPFDVVLACGFTPLHVQSFLGAWLQQTLPARRISVTAGLYGNLAGTLESLSSTKSHAVAVALEWPDFDPRLGYRGTGVWGLVAIEDILHGVPAMLERIAAAVEGLPGVPVAVSLPTLALPPLFHTPGWQASEAELALDRLLADFAARVSRHPHARLLNRRRLDEESPAEGRYDARTDLATGLPYSLRHASSVGAALARLIAPPAPKKGLITDLDDTLWSGLVGEIGAENVAWDLASHHQLHGLYQNLLETLAEEGVLVAIASKNDRAVVERALERKDLLLKPERVFPVEVHWEPKSASVQRILGAWNIGADSVVFVDDSPMELAEVAAAHAGIECLQFPRQDDAGGVLLLSRLRDLFGKPRLAREDALRLESMRQGAAFREVAASGSGAEDFLRTAGARITFEFGKAGDARVLELVNKTNQFNLNGIRYTEADWSQRLSEPGAVLAAVGYEDRFGPLGKIAVLRGRQRDDADGTLEIETWVMSCRAFSRRIEYQALRTLFARSGARKMVFAFAPTPKNGPTAEFLASLAGLTDAGSGPVTITSAAFEERCPPLYHEVEEIHHDSTLWTSPTA